jgi:hypothetical protein
MKRYNSKSFERVENGDENNEDQTEKPDQFTIRVD